MGVRTWTAAAGAGAAGAAALLAGCAQMGPPPPAPAGALTASRCGDERFPVYFARGSAALQPAAQAVIRSASQRVSGCRVTGVDVVGLALPDAPGRPADPALTQRRAENVAQALAAAGLPGPAFDVQVAGAARTVPGARTPLPRRTEVVLHAVPIPG